MWMFGKLRSYCLPYRWTLYVAVVTLGLVTITNLMVPYLTKALFNDVLGRHQWREVWWIVGAVPALALIGGVFNFIQGYLSGLFGQKSTFALRQALYTRLQYHGFEYYDREHTGNLMQRLTGDVEAWRMYLSQGLISGFNFLFNVGFGLVVMFTLNVRLTLLTLVFMPFLAVAVLRFDQQVRPVYTLIRRAASRLQTVVQENIMAIRVVKTFAREPFEMQKFEERNREYGRRNIDAGNSQARYIPLMQWIGNLSAVVLLWVGGAQVISGQTSIGALVAFFGLLGYLTGPTQQLGFLVNLFAQSAAAEQRLLEILETPDAVRDRPGAVPLLLERARGHVRLEGVTFRFPGMQGPPALKDVSLDAPPGKVIALVGPTGSGKSSLVSLIPRFYECQQGRVLVDGCDVKDWTITSLRRQVGMVPGETFLFSASVFENLSYGRRDATLAEVRRAARIAAADDFIMEMPEGYETIVGERGLGLSGGQKQRVALARALLYDPRILVFDDATSSVDMETEYEIQQALQAAMAGRTTFIIAHRLSSVRRADEILVLDRGMVVERGHHDDLLRRGGLYREIFDIQFRDFGALRAQDAAADPRRATATDGPRVQGVGGGAS